MKKLIYLPLLFVTLFNNTTFALEDSRPQSSGDERLFEVTAGQVKVGEHEIFEVGVDYEYFVPGWEHHLSFGVASEIEFLQKDEYYLGPLVSLYYFHTKAFYTSGIQTDFSGKSYWKNRVGLGYEFFVKEHVIIVPTIAVDRAEGEYHRAFNIGFAWEF